ncbi:hypothetical protein [Actinocrispum wychmicini]|uniref:Uncharacterized protein n=1 Tax=Actinocrispum wychmicini TaxID=1213861 RepID=A0A4V2S6S4_9PSEU|nr:hypothetical protein [Actinocrispum wychmicini]TCO57140.1 hypothetical protein EV192_106617 [Actinocrispum wychmicini]
MTNDGPQAAQTRAEIGDARPAMPVIRIESPNGHPTNTKVTVDGVTIPCTRVTWTCSVSNVATAILEVPRVLIEAALDATLVTVERAHPKQVDD